jgi:hypothetical protein
MNNLLGQIFQDKFGVRWRIIEHNDTRVIIRAVAGKAELRVRTANLLKKFTRLS